MSYMVMECHPAYAVVLDENGRFLKVANLNYQVGQTVPSVLEMSPPKKPAFKAIWASVSAAACLGLLVLGGWQFLLTPYGTVRMQINPDVEMTVNRLDYVTQVTGLNEEGSQLVDDYGYSLKKVDQVSNELADRALEMGYLQDGGFVQLTVQSEDSQWCIGTEDRLIAEMSSHLGTAITVSGEPAPETGPSSSGQEIVIPVPSSSEPATETWNPESPVSSETVPDKPPAISSVPKEDSSVPVNESMPVSDADSNGATDDSYKDDDGSSRDDDDLDDDDSSRDDDDLDDDDSSDEIDDDSDDQDMDTEEDDDNDDDENDNDDQQDD